MEQLKDWGKVVLAWLATIGGYLTEHITLGKIALLLTVVLTCFQIYKVWMDIRMRRKQLSLLEKHHVNRFR